MLFHQTGIIWSNEQILLETEGAVGNWANLEHGEYPGRLRILYQKSTQILSTKYNVKRITKAKVSIISLE